MDLVVCQSQILTAKKKNQFTNKGDDYIKHCFFPPLRHNGDDIWSHLH